MIDFMRRSGFLLERRLLSFTTSGRLFAANGINE